MQCKSVVCSEKTVKVNQIVYDCVTIWICVVITVVQLVV